MTKEEDIPGGAERVFGFTLYFLQTVGFGHLAGDYFLRSACLLTFLARAFMMEMMT
jgi:hypothetical protein